MSRRQNAPRSPSRSSLIRSVAVSPPHCPPDGVRNTPPVQASLRTRGGRGARFLILASGRSLEGRWLAHTGLRAARRRVIEHAPGPRSALIWPVGGRNPAQSRKDGWVGAWT
ncbi:t129 [Tupaiid betaherpesvirus 1]|uniref:T129 n=1 Tax=Tupaiid herpesvirus 1 (strain 1) TaxID=10397 RepID=Q91TG7_TUHV1|nr:t129 [Tupaiid betaherpesvirus 1]AAK57180.1 t129 [Tupaiid betaherpesvirus 1]